METKILLWNTRGWKNKKDELIKRIQDYDICVTTATKNEVNEDFKILGYITITKDRMRKGASRGDNNNKKEPQNKSTKCSFTKCKG